MESRSSTISIAWEASTCHYYMEQCGEYALGHYNEEEARLDMQCWLDIDTAAAYAYAIAMGLIKCTLGVGGPEGANIAQD